MSYPSAGITRRQSHMEPDRRGQLAVEPPRTRRSFLRRGHDSRSNHRVSASVRRRGRHSGPLRSPTRSRWEEEHPSSDNFFFNVILLKTSLVLPPRQIRTTSAPRWSYRTRRQPSTPTDVRRPWTTWANRPSPTNNITDRLLRSCRRPTATSTWRSAIRCGSAVTSRKNGPLTSRPITTSRSTRSCKERLKWTTLSRTYHLTRIARCPGTGHKSTLGLPKWLRDS